MHPYSSSDNRTSALGAITVVAVLLAIGANALFNRLAIGPPWLFSPPTVAVSFGLLYRVMDTVAWRWPLLHRLGVVQVPLLQGTYEGDLVSSHGQTKLPVRICIDQTWTRVAVRLDVLTPISSTSQSISAGLFVDGHHQTRLIYTYRNRTLPGVADPAISDHDGTADVVIDARTGELSGRYFTVRATQGTLGLRRVRT